MRKPQAIPLTLLGAAALLSLSACKSKQLQRCIDPESKLVVPDDKCDHPPVMADHVYPYYRWYYGGTGFYPGNVVFGGSFEPAPDESIVRVSSPEGASIIRGGFGGGFFGGGA